MRHRARQAKRHGGGGSTAAANSWRALALTANLALIACAGPPGSARPPLPRGCVEEQAWPAYVEIARERAEACSNPSSEAARERCVREDYLESACAGINGWRESVGGDPELASFDVHFPWPELQWIDEALDLSPGHTGSESWADHLGLAGYHDNSIKKRRRKVMNALTFGLAQHWYDARGLGSPPDEIWDPGPASASSGSLPGIGD